jgi:hypothetical protein
MVEENNSDVARNFSWLVWNHGILTDFPETVGVME